MYDPVVNRKELPCDDSKTQAIEHRPEAVTVTTVPVTDRKPGGGGYRQAYVPQIVCAGCAALPCQPKEIGPQARTQWAIEEGEAYAKTCVGPFTAEQAAAMSTGAFALEVS